LKVAQSHGGVEPEQALRDDSVLYMCLTAGLTTAALLLLLLLLSCAGRWQQPKAPLLAVPLNMTAGYSMWRNMDAALSWTKEWVKGKPLFTKRH
jgi:hypothetical protein